MQQNEKWTLRSECPIRDVLDRIGAQAADADRDAMDHTGSPTQWLVFARSPA